MPQSPAQIYVHIIFSTKNRQPFLSHTSRFAAICTIARNMACHWMSGMRGTDAASLWHAFSVQGLCGGTEDLGFRSLGLASLLQPVGSALLPHCGKRAA